MEAAHQDLELVHREIASRAERLTITRKAKPCSHCRDWSNETRSDERMFHDHLDRLTFERCGEIDALSRKLARQERTLSKVPRSWAPMQPARFCEPDHFEGPVRDPVAASLAMVGGRGAVPMHPFAVGCPPLVGTPFGWSRP